MKFSDYYHTLNKAQRLDLANKAETSKAYLSQLAHGHRRAGVRLIAAIERATSGTVTRADLRPDIFGSSSEPPEAT